MANSCDRKGFNLVTLALLGAFCVGLSALQLLNPVNRVSKAPHAVLPLAAAQKIDQARIDVIPNKPTAAEAGRFTAFDVNHTFTKLGYELTPVLEGNAAVPRLFLSSLPYDLGTLKQSNERKSLFFRTLLPLVLKINETLVSNRAKIWRLQHRLNLGQHVQPEEHIWLNATFNNYGVKQNDFASLLRKMDVIPPSLALAQAAVESGWGTSRFAREGNALFGQWTFDPNDKGILPAGREAGKTHRIKAFDDLAGSLAAYVHNLNTHKAYKNLRTDRENMRNSRTGINGYQLASNLIKYSERGEQYVTSLQAIMTKNDLLRFDKARLDDSKLDSLTGPLI